MPNPDVAPFSAAKARQRSEEEMRRADRMRDATFPNACALADEVEALALTLSRYADLVESENA